MEKLGIDKKSKVDEKDTKKGGSSDEIKKLTKKLEETLQKALEISNNIKKDPPKRRRKLKSKNKKIQMILKDASLIDNKIASKTNSESKEVKEVNKSRKLAIRKAIDLSNKISDRQVRNIQQILNYNSELSMEIENAIDLSSEMKQMADEATANDEAEASDEAEMSDDLTVDDEALDSIAEIVKNIKMDDDVAIEQGIERRMAFANNIEGVNVQSKQNVEEINMRGRRVALGQSHLYHHSPANDLQFNKVFKRLAMQNDEISNDDGKL